MGSVGCGCGEARTSAHYCQCYTVFEKFEVLLTPCVMAPPFDVNVRYLSEVEGFTCDLIPSGCA